MPVFLKCWLNSKVLVIEKPGISISNVKDIFHEITGIPKDVVYLSDYCKALKDDAKVTDGSTIFAHLQLNGGKGGFGSMLRAIGAQIEKTTNREACRDLSGRRLRDINEEKRLKQWLVKQKERESEAAQKKQEKLEKIRQEPKHQFNDREYEKERSELAERISNAVEEGLKKTVKSEEQVKRKAPMPEIPTKKPRLWLGIDEDLEDSASSSEDEQDRADSDKIHNDYAKNTQLNLTEYQSIEDLKTKLGNEGITNMLKSLDLKTGGTIEEKTERLWAIINGKKDKINIKKLVNPES